MPMRKHGLEPEVFDSAKYRISGAWVCRYKARINSFGLRASHLMKCSPLRRSTVTVNKTAHHWRLYTCIKYLMAMEEVELARSFSNHVKTQHYRFEQVLQKSHTFLSYSPKSLYIGCQLVQNGTCRSSSLEEELEVYSSGIFYSGKRAMPNGFHGYMSMTAMLR